MSQRIVIKAKDSKNPLASVDKKKYGKQIIVDPTTEKVLKVVTVTGPGIVDQSYKDMCQIKNLVSKTESKGLLRASTKFEGEMDDFPAYDFQEAQFKIAYAKNMFEQLPSGVRAKFENDPGKFMNFANDPNNAQAMINMGLKKGIDGIDHTGTVTKQSDGVTPTTEVINPTPQPTPETPPA